MHASLIKKRIEYRLARVAVSLDLSQSLFSSYRVDIGTQMLLASLRHTSTLDYDKMLELGCGSGGIGIFLRKSRPGSELHMTDRDMLAVAFAEHNAALNTIDAKCYGSIDFRAVPSSDFSLIAFNFPAKLECEGLAAFVSGASRHLRSGGSLVFVVVSELAAEAEEVINKPVIRCDYAKHGKGHSVFHLSFKEPLPAVEFSYERSSMTLPLPGAPRVTTARGLPEFDTLSFASEALIKLLQRSPAVRSAALVGPGQGHAAVAAAALLRPSRIALIGRDLLGLAYAERNLRQHFRGEVEARALPCLSAPPSEDLLIWRIEDKNDLELHLVNAAALAESGRALIACGEQGLIDAVAAKSGLEVHHQERCRHCVAVTLS